MNITIIYDPNNNPIGWEMSGENQEEIKKLAIIRDLQFFGYDSTAIKYNGRKQSDDKNGNPGILSWIQRRIQTDKK